MSKYQSEIFFATILNLNFSVRLHLQQGLALINSPGAQRVKEDEEAFTVPEKLRAVVMGVSTSL
jgi:hypothetical protein